MINLRYISKVTYLTKGTSGIIMEGKMDGKEVICKFERVALKHNNLPYQWVCCMKMNTLCDNFPKLYDFMYSVNCNFSNTRMFQGDIKVIRQVIKENICAVGLYEKINGINTIADMSFCAQLLWAIHCLHSTGYTHNDIAYRNILQEKAESITCGEYQFPTTHRTVLCDFGEVSKYTVRGKNVELGYFLNLFIDKGNYISYIRSHNIKPNYDKLPKTPKNIKLWANIYWHQLTDFDNTMKILLGKNYVGELDFKYRIPKEDILHFLTCDTALECFNYCISKLKLVQPVLVDRGHPKIKNSDKLVYEYMKLWSQEPNYFMTVSKVYNDGFVCEKPPYTLDERKPSEESVSYLRDFLIKNKYKFILSDKYFGVNEKNNLVAFKLP